MKREIIPFGNLSKLTKTILVVCLVYFLLFVLALLQARAVVSLPARLTIGPLEISLYGVLLTTGFVVSYYLLYILKPSLARQFELFEVLIFVVLPSVIFARAWHVVTDFHLYDDNLLGVFDYQEGGLAIYGAILGGGLGVFGLTRLKKINFREVVGLVPIVLPLGQAIGRFGNIINQELFGPPTGLPWGIYIDPEKRPLRYMQEEYFHPASLYESVLNLILFLGLIILYKYRKRFDVKGLFFLWSYLAGYGCIRFVIEFFRLDRLENIVFWEFSFNQIVALFMVFVGIIMLTKGKLKKENGKN